MKLSAPLGALQEGYQLQRYRNESDQARGCNPSRVTVTSRRFRLNLTALLLAPFRLGGLLDRRVVLLNHLLVTVDLLREAPALEALEALGRRRCQGFLNVGFEYRRVDASDHRYARPHTLGVYARQ